MRTETLLQKTQRLKALREAARPKSNISAVSVQLYDLNTKFKHGKHEGKMIEDVIESDPSYITYALENWKGFELTAAAELAYQERLDVRAPPRAWQ